MLLKRVFVGLVFCFPLALSVGCGGGVAPGVADGADEPEPDMTPEEEASEMDAAKSAATN